MMTRLKSRRFRPRGAGIALLAVLLLACASSGQLVRLSELQVSPDFDRAKLERAHVAIYGFEGDPVGQSTTPRDVLDYRIYQSLRLAFPHASLVGAKTLRAGLKASNDSVATRPTTPSRYPDGITRAALQEASRGADYLVFATLLSNEVIKTDAQSDDEVTYCTTRAIAARYQVLDLRRDETVWRGDLRQQSRRCRTSSRSNVVAKSEGVGGFFAALAVDVATDVATDAIFGMHPEPPRLPLLVRETSSDFAEALAGSKRLRR